MSVFLSGNPDDISKEISRLGGGGGKCECDFVFITYPKLAGKKERKKEHIKLPNCNMDLFTVTTRPAVIVRGPRNHLPLYVIKILFQIRNRTKNNE